MQKFLALVFFLSFYFGSYAQSNVEIGVMAGGGYYIGDLNPTRHLNQNMVNPALGVYTRYNFNGRWAFKIAAATTKVNADDALATNPIIQQRNLSFQSNIHELNLVFEFNFMEFSNYNLNQRFSPYIFGGLGFFLMEPHAMLNGNLYNLRQFTTEGQVEPYSRFQASFPFGVGLKIQALKKFFIGFEWGMRKTFTDYLDDVSTVYPLPGTVSNLSASLSNKSLNQNTALNNNWGAQRGNSQTNDWYGVVGICLSFKLGINPSECRFNPY